MFGEKFKELRKEQNISLATAAENITTVSTLSRWENGQTNIKFEQMIELLNNIHFSLLEFISITIITPHTPFVDQVNKALNANSDLELRQLGLKWIKIYHTSHQQDDLLNAATACSFYLNLTSKNIFPHNYLEELIDAFSKVNYWSHYYIVNFGNSLMLLPPKNIYGFASLIINNLLEIKKGGFEYFIDTIDTLLNAAQILIYFSPDHAKLLLDKLNNIQLTKYSMYIIVRRQFLNQLLHYKLTGDSTFLTKLLSTLNILEMNSMTQMFEEAYKRVKLEN
ncbi:helix-turn-helix domain-containing protein [Lactobacillus rodentium]|uniref:XRE family transcriptional regulator n=1 Tax=Lactobacillus rodentium TaxID=947835 RepID=A0A2Z6T7C8_9LACO|nr:Rgg/GadR/MutR family transcriptional regulator [Lactobacillus rodentium]MCR1895050.1 helix-turn-helix domain-containing protein [Lactobacillus rodentium]GBG05334.1 XRE family transcriptional regulator [Lactobacillus rodentium]